jgi:response regulator RpfG family c-di-GMP phosphodiesterase
MIPKTARETRILVVEDVQETRDAIEALLSRDGYRVEPARDETDAIALFVLFRRRSLPAPTLNVIPTLHKQVFATSLCGAGGGAWLDSETRSSFR